MLGGHALVVWKIAEPISKVVAWHHQPVRAYAHGGDVGLMVAIVRIADRLDRFFVHGIAPSLADWVAIAESSDGSYLDLDAEQLAERWSAIQAARIEALGVFVRA